MNVNVDSAGNDQPPGGIDDLGARAGALGQARANGRNSLAANRDVGARFTLGADHRPVGNHNVVIHGGFLAGLEDESWSLITALMAENPRIGRARGSAPLPSRGR